MVPESFHFRSIVVCIVRPCILDERRGRSFMVRQGSRELDERLTTNELLGIM